MLTKILKYYGRNSSDTPKLLLQLLLFTGAYSCPAMPDKKHRASAQCGKLDKNSLTSEPRVCFCPVFPAP